jgi:hypothetical protein
VWLLLVRVFQAAISAFATIGLALHGAGEWDLSRDEVVYLAILLALSAVVEPLVRGVMDRSKARRLERERKITETLHGALVQVVRIGALDWERVGVNAFLVKRNPVRFWRRRLRRCGRVRLANISPSSRVEWTEGKGVIGTCWHVGQDQGADLQSVFAPLARDTAFSWNAMPVDTRMGLSHDDYTRTKQYEAVVATPITNADDKVVGVVSLDGPSASFPVLFGDHIRGTLADTGRTIWNLVS